MESKEKGKKSELLRKQSSTKIPLVRCYMCGEEVPLSELNRVEEAVGVVGVCEECFKKRTNKWIRTQPGETGGLENRIVGALLKALRKVVENGTKEHR